MLIKQINQKNTIFVTNYLCNGCHDLMQKPTSFNNVAFVYVKGNAYRIFGI